MKLQLVCVLAAGSLLGVTGFSQDAPATGDGQVYKARKANQQKRIDNGVKSGKLSTGQAAGLEHKDAKINHEVAKDAAQNGGTLTPGDKAKVHHDMNKESKKIAKDKNVTPRGPAE